MNINAQHLLSNFFADGGTLVALCVIPVLGTLISLFAVRFGVGAVIRYITGNAPGWYGYDSSKGSGESYYHPRQNVRSKSGSINLLD